MRVEEKFNLIRVNRMYNKLNASSIISTPVVETPLCFRHFLLLFAKCASSTEILMNCVPVVFERE